MAIHILQERADRSTRPRSGQAEWDVADVRPGALILAWSRKVSGAKETAWKYVLQRIDRLTV